MVVDRHDVGQNREPERRIVAKGLRRLDEDLARHDDRRHAVTGLDSLDSSGAAGERARQRFDDCGGLHDEREARGQADIFI